jgi:LacI family transcriptional regulator
MKQFSTLKKLSEKLNLSISTVSRALKDHPDISPTTRKRVKELAVLMEYEPNTFALNLRTNKSKIIGVIVPYFQNLFYEYFIAALDEEVRKMGYALLILQSGESVEAELKNLNIMKKNRVDVLFVSTTDNTEDIEPLLKFSETGIPIVFFDRVPSFEGCDKIRFADTVLGVVAAKRLIKSNKKSILCLFTDNPQLNTVNNRVTAFRETYEKLAPRAKLDIRFHADRFAGERVISKALQAKNPPDALFCIGDNSMIWSLKTLQKKGLRIPIDIGILAISNGFIPTLFTPAITHIVTNGYKLGKLAFTRLKEVLEGETSAKEMIIKSVLVEGGSL